MPFFKEPEYFLHDCPQSDCCNIRPLQSTLLISLPKQQGGLRWLKVELVHELKDLNSQLNKG